MENLEGVSAPDAGKQQGDVQGDDISTPVAPDNQATVPQDEGPIGAELRQLARGYGLTDDEIGSFQDEVSLRATMSVLDRRVVDTYRQQSKQAQPSAEGQQALSQPPAATPPQWQQPPPTNGQPVQQPPADEFKIELTDLEVGDQVRVAIEKLANERNSLRNTVDQMSQFVQWQFQQEQQRQAQEILHRFHESLDTVDSDLYGRYGTATQAQLQKRQEVFEPFVAHYGYAMQSGQWPDIRMCVSRARNAVHGMDFTSAAQRNRSEAIRERSQQRSAVGRAGGVPGGTERDSSGLRDLKNDPDFMASLREEYYGAAS